LLQYPSIDPAMLSFNLFGREMAIRWYGFFYVASFILGYIFYRRVLKIRGVKITRDQYEGIIFSIMLGVILGGRLGYVLFYNLPWYLRHPQEILFVWEGGMSFHGGALGVIIATWIYLKRQKLNFFKLADPAMPLVAIGLGLGRLGNFINAELWGKVTNLPWGMVFPGGGPLPRHPSQLYEAFSEGLLLFVILYVLSRKVNTRGVVFGVFLAGYGLLRFIMEFFREPDPQIGFVFLSLTMGQTLCLIMVAAGLGLIGWRLKSRRD